MRFHRNIRWRGHKIHYELQMNVYWTEAKNLELFCPQSSGSFYTINAIIIMTIKAL